MHTSTSTQADYFSGIPVAVPYSKVFGILWAIDHNPSAVFIEENAETVKHDGGHRSKPFVLINNARRS